MKKHFNSIGVLLGVTALFLGLSFLGGIGHGPSEAATETPKEIPAVTIAPSLPPEVSDRALPEAEEAKAPEVKVPETINGLLIGFDRTHGLTDVIMVGHIDPASNEVQVISIPRDLEVYFTDEAFAHIKKNNPKNRILHAKVNNIYSLIGWDERALQDIKAIAEVITGLEIDYMMTIDIDGFKDMVDAMGGVTFDVPQRMYYNDPYQDLHIDLQKGVQVLDGDKAEQLVRFRKGYERGDLQRIEVQQAFIAAMVDQVIHKSDFNEIAQLVSAGYEMMDTDFGLVVMLEYAEFFFNLDMEHVLSKDTMMTIPSWGEKVEGHWFQFFDLEEAREAVDKLVNGQEEK